ncbi:hypothetical protein DMN91_007259, partial [Ooceraea biroi]
ILKSSGGYISVLLANQN